MARSKPAPNLDLQRERFRQQMTRTTLSERTHISRKALIDIEKRRTKVRLNTAAKIAKALDCEITDLFSPDEVIG